jgi:dTDP-4-dehydrorhamnose reductase
VVGAGGMLGVDLVDVLQAAGQQVSGLGRDRLDVRDPQACHRAVTEYDVVVNAAAYTAVDDAECHEPEAFTVNATGAANLARACTAQGARLVHVSTDYVFDGTSAAPYAEDAPLAPASAYGRTKAAGEWAVRAECDDVLLLRTAWLYGAHGRCFPRTIASALQTRETLDVVDDQVGQPTWTRDVAALALSLIDADAPPGTYHATSGGMTSWFGFAQQVAVAVGTDPARVRPTTSEAFSRPAPRPAFSALAHTTFGSDVLRGRGVSPIGDWRERFTVAAPQVLGEPVQHRA